jgi:hypothetical protein
MVPMTWLGVPILLSAIIVFVASAIIHMVLPFYKSDRRKLPREDAVMEALRGFDIPPGDYWAPHSGSPEEMKRGPIVYMTLSSGGPRSMASRLVPWFLNIALVSFFSAYAAGRTLPPGAPYLAAFRLVGCTAFMGYSLALPQDSIFLNRNWGTTLRTMFDSLVYGLLTAGTFGWLWPC